MKTLLKKYEELTKLMNEASKNKDYKNALKIQKERNKVAVEYQKKNNLIWNQETWITQITSDNFKSYEEARNNLFNKIKNLPGVEVLSDKKGVKTIKVTSDWNVYIYEVRAHNAYEKCGTKIVKDLFTGENEEVPDYKPIVYASLGKNIFKAKRNTEDFEIKIGE